MHKKVIIAASAIAAIAIAIGLLVPIVTQPDRTQRPIYSYDVRKITIDNVILDVEIADDGKKIERGLMFRESLPEDRGMLFVFDKERKYQFWMMNMNFNLDIIWFDANGKAVHIVEDAQPCIDAAHTSLCTFNPDEPAKYVLEVKSGFVKEHGIDEISVMRILT
ncbi:MAG: DUF192 domain-containing protein [Nitrososphaerales archaeon]